MAPHDHHAGPMAVPATGLPATDGLTITEAAAHKLRDFLAKEGKDAATTGLRLGVQGGGCSGYSYVMDFDTERPGDTVVEREGVKLFVDAKSLGLLNGAALDYQETLMGAGFAVKNPQVKGTCGCGQSFQV